MKGFTESEPIYGATVTASQLRYSKKALAYLPEVLPMSPRLASAITKIPGSFDFI